MSNLEQQFPSVKTDLIVFTQIVETITVASFH